MDSIGNNFISFDVSKDAQGNPLMMVNVLFHSVTVRVEVTR